jgi:hypothetical protein
LLAVVALAVTIVTKGAAAKLFTGLFSSVGASTGAAAAAGSVVGVAAAAATGSIVSQSVGVATGIQEKFSWKAVALSAIAGGIGAAGIGGASLGISNPTLQAMARGAVSSAIAQGIGVITGLQDKFSWAGVAAAGVGAGVGQFVAGTKLAGAIGARSALAGDIFISGADAIGNAATRSLIEGTDFGDNIAAALPDVIGGAIGRWIGGGGFSRMSEAARMRAEAADTKVDPLTIKPMNDRIVVDYSRAGLDPITAQMPIAGAPEAGFKSEADRAAGDTWINKVSARIGANLEPAQATGVELGLRRRDLAAIANAPISGAANNTNPTWPFGEFENTGRLSDIPKRPVGFAVEAGKEIWNGMEAGFGGGAIVSGGAGLVGAIQNGSKLEAEAARVWGRSGIGPALRGRLLESVELIGYQIGIRLAPNQPVIDHFANGVATSVKSINLANPSYQSGNRLSQLLTRQVDSIAAYRGSNFGGARILKNEIAARQLVVIIPRGATTAQTVTLNQAQVYARTKNVTMVVRSFP